MKVRIPLFNVECLMCNEETVTTTLHITRYTLHGIR